MKKKIYLTQDQQKTSEEELKRLHIEKKLKQLLKLNNMELYYLS